VCPPASLVEAVTPSSSPFSSSSIGSGVTPLSPTSARFCSAPPPGGLLLPRYMAGPMWYYPLTGSSLTSWPTGMYGGSSFGDVTWVTDGPALGDTTVLDCGTGENGCRLQALLFCRQTIVGHILSMMHMLSGDGLLAGCKVSHLNSVCCSYQLQVSPRCHWHHPVTAPLVPLP
jgi:hypothetical protein